MRRDGKFGLARTLRRCSAGRCHPNPSATSKSVEQLRSVFAAWCKAVGSDMRPWQHPQVANCTGPRGGHSSSKGQARMCFGTNFSHIARCGMCRIGNPCKSLKKNQGTKERRQHLDQLQEARIAVGQKAVVADDCVAAFTMQVWDNVGHVKHRLKVKSDTGTAKTPSDADVLCQVACPLSLFVKCKTRCLGCRPYKQRSEPSTIASATGGQLSPDDLPQIDGDWYLL